MKEAGKHVTAGLAFEILWVGLRVSPEEAIVARAPWRTPEIICRRGAGGLLRAAPLVLVVVIEETLQLFVVLIIIILIFRTLFPVCCGAPYMVHESV